MSNLNTCAFVSTRGLCIAPDVASTNINYNNKSTINNNNTNSQQPKPLFFERALNHPSVSHSNNASFSKYGSNKTMLPQQRRKHASESSTDESVESDSSRSSSNSSSRLSSTDNLNLSDDSCKKTDFIDFNDNNAADSMLLDFQCALSAEKQVEWRTLFLNNILFVDVPASVLPEGSRDSFVSLLEFAEEKLECDKVFVCFKRNRVDRTALMRVFMFLGFTIVPPGSKDVPQNEDIMAMVYNID